jgi:predicted DNA binding CopG/RHH family protein
VVTDKYGKTDKSNTVTVGTPVKITTQPKTTYTKQGDTAKVSVKATGDGLKYQWYIKNAGTSTWKKSSVTASTYTVEMSSGSKNRQVYCVVTNKYGISVKTNTVTLRMAATVTKQPTTAYASNGERISTTVKAAGDGLTYQWYVRDTYDDRYYKSTMTTETYYMTMVEAKAGRKVYCVITDKYGNSVKTNAVYLRMAATITTQPKNVNVEMGKTAKVTVKAIGDGLTYQWYIKNAGSSKWVKSSVTTNTYSVKMSAAVEGRQVYCVVRDKYGNSVKSKTVTLNPNQLKASFDLEVTWGFVDDLFCNYAVCTVTASGGKGDYLYKFNVYIDADDTVPATGNTFSEDNVYRYWYTDGSSIAGTV